MSKIKDRFMDWLAPGLRQEVYRQAMINEAIFDLHVLRLPIIPATWDEAIANCTALQADLAAGKITLKDRAMSLIEILKRKGVIKCHQ